MKKKTEGGYYFDDEFDEVYKYSTWNCLKYMVRFSVRNDKWLIPLMAVSAGAFYGVDFLWTIVNKYVVDFAFAVEARQKLLVIISVLIMVILILKLIHGSLEAKVCETRFRKCRYAIVRKLYEKQLYMDYENLEKPAVKTLFEGAKQQSVNSMMEFYFRVRDTIGLFFSFAGYTTLICMLSPWLVLIILVPTVAYYYIVKYKITWFNRHWKDWTDTERKLGYIKRKASDFAYAKDVRLYNMEGWIGQMVRKFLEERLFWYKKQGKVEGLNGFLQLLAVSVRDIAAYGFIVWNLAKGNLGAGDFVLYFSSVGQVSYVFYHMMDHIASLGWITANISRYREFLEVEDASNQNAGKELPKGDFSIRFENVCYRYGGAKEDTIHNLSFTIKSGEKIAIVGNNGAGKTTIVKLLCGMYRRTGGEIYIGEHSIDAYNRDALFQLYATVFQDIHVMPTSITENIVMKGCVDLNNLRYALEHSGIMEKVKMLPDGIDTYLVKSVYDKATDFSGGELQKLAFARALYKQKTYGAKVLLLDEPTAALDPLAEQKMYQEYAQFAQGKISVFISHRLASTQFCDRIFYLKNGSIVECGTHSELLAAGGEYAKIFEVQSRYYRQKKAYAETFGESEVCYE